MFLFHARDAWPLLIIMGVIVRRDRGSTAPDDAAATLMIRGKERQFDKRNSVRLSNSLGKQLRAEIAAGTQQTGEEALFQLIAADASGVGADVECRHYLAGCVIHRHRN